MHILTFCVRLSKGHRENHCQDSIVLFIIMSMRDVFEVGPSVLRRQSSVYYDRRRARRRRSQEGVDGLRTDNAMRRTTRTLCFVYPCMRSLVRIEPFTFYCRERTKMAETLPDSQTGCLPPHTPSEPEQFK